MALTKITGQVVDTTTDLVVGVTTVGGGVSAVDGFFSGILTAVGNASFSGSVSVGGTLTYEDVTNIDAVGLVTARNGIVVGSGITLSKDGDGFFTGIVTATTFSGAFSGDGSALTGVANTDVIFPDKISLGDGTQTDGDQINVGLGSDLRIYHASDVSYIDVPQGGFSLRGTGNDNVLVYTSNSDVEIYHDGSKKFETSSSGVTITGTLAATAVTGDGSALTGVGVTVADGGDVSYSYESGGKNYMIHIFTSTGKNGVFRTNKDMTIDFLLVGGGGGTAAAEGSYGQSGAGGGGGIVEGSGFSLSAGSYVVEVGAGGAATNSTTVGGNGGDTTFASVTAKGGGGGGDYGSAGADGGCGGGGGDPNAAGGATNQSSQNGGISNITQFGFAGGQGGAYNTSPRGGGGGGGAGGAGGTATAAGDGGGGARGAGRANNITGTNVTYSIGGRGGRTGYEHGFPGEQNLGNGADGASATHPNEGFGAVGGAGIVVIRYEV